MIRVSQIGLQMSKRYYWLKLKDDFFIDPKIKKLRKIAGGDTYTVILLKLMLLTLKTDGILIFEGIEETLQGELSLKLDEDENNINATLIFMEKMQLIIELDAYRYSLPQMALLTGTETQWAERKRKQRAKGKEKKGTLSKPCPKKVTLEKENKREELEKETDTEKESIEKWLHAKSKNANNPHTYKAKMRQLIEVQDRDALEELHSWNKEQYESAVEKAFIKTVNEFDYSPLKKLDGKPIQNVISDKGTSYLDIHFKDGSHMSVPKEQIYLSITQGGVTHESL